MAENVPFYAGVYHIPNDAQYWSRQAPYWLPQISLSSVTKLHDIASRTALTQTFVNPSNVSPIAGATYTFPLYESCAIVSFRCRVGTRLIEGIVKEKEEASATYQEAIRRNEPASLLEQQTSDVFSTSLGNIPPGETVKVEIEYIMELKHDAELDGLRFTIPTCIAPRYGEPPAGINPFAVNTSVAVKGINISVEISMSSYIRSIQSPSHQIWKYLGGHVQHSAGDNIDLRQAVVSLGQTFTELDKDFVLLIKCANLSSPRALLETHSKISNSKALMLTLVPKFNLPEDSRPEVVFIVDRSGSMIPRIAPLKSSLSVFLKSLPLGVRFNICSFGTKYSFLWAQSRPYSDQSFEEAQRHCNTMEANFGGTEILAAIKATVASRTQGLNLEIMVLTDGQVWNTEELFKYVESATAKGDVRLFSLGIGRDVSHGLIDGLARVGRGFSQVVSDEREGMESKVARMLRGGLSAHILDYRVEWDGKPTEDDIVARRPSIISTTVRRINLFDTDANPDSPTSFSNPPDFVVPSVLQAPYKLPPLFPFSRTTAYAILSQDARPPSRVWLRGTTPSGDELELELPVHSVPANGETVHQLAARKILQELKEGTGYLHSGKYGISKESHPSAFEDCVKREGVRVGLKYGLASHWTSFVAVTQTKDEQRVNEESLTGLDDDESYEFVDGNDGDGSNSDITGGATSGHNVLPSQFTSSVPVMMMTPPRPPAITQPLKKSPFSSGLFPQLYKSQPGTGGQADTKPSSFSSYPSSSPYSLSSGKGSPTSNFRPSSKSKSEQEREYYSAYFYSDSSESPSSLSSGKVSQKPNPKHFSNAPPSYSAPTPSETSFSPTLSLDKSDGTLPDDYFFSSWSPPNSPSKGSRDNLKQTDDKAHRPLSASLKPRPTFSKPPGSKLPFKGSEFKTPDVSITYSPSNAPPAARITSGMGTEQLSQRTRALIDLQTYNGSFLLDSALAGLLGTSTLFLQAKLDDFALTVPNLSWEHKVRLWATILVIKVFETQMASERSVWQLVVDKARVWMRNSAMVSEADIQTLEKLAEKVLGP